jgi:hypothetical protein
MKAGRGSANVVDAFAMRVILFPVAWRNATTMNGPEDVAPLRPVLFCADFWSYGSPPSDGGDPSSVNARMIVLMLAGVLLGR